MIQYIDVCDIVHNLPESVNGNPFYTPRLEIDVCLLEGLTIESGGTRKLRTNIGICNILIHTMLTSLGSKTMHAFSQKTVF